MRREILHTFCNSPSQVQLPRNNIRLKETKEITKKRKKVRERNSYKSEL